MKRPQRVFCGGLAASAFVAITQLITRSDPLPPPLFWAVVCFAIAIPPLVVFTFMPSRLPTEVEGHAADTARFGIRIQYLGIGTSLIGIVLLFFGFGWLPGFVFFFSFITSGIFLIRYTGSTPTRGSQ